MAREFFEDDCPGCRPAIIDIKTGKVCDQNDPIMQRMMEIWKNTTLDERKAYHRVMCLNSRDPGDMNAVQNIMARLQGN